MQHVGVPYPASVDKAWTLLANRAGYTIKRSNGGVATFEGGYLVGGDGLALTLKLDPDISSRDVLAVARWIDAQPYRLYVPEQYLGVWTDPATGLTHFDLSTHVSDLDAALDLGERRGQIAIFDLSTYTDIAVDANADGELAINPS